MALLPFVSSLPSGQVPGYGYAPAPYAPAPGYGFPPAPGYGGYGGYGYETPKHNCSVLDVIETAEVCTPVIETNCEIVALPIKVIKEIDFTYTVTRTVCTESIEVVPQEVCSYSYEQVTEDTTAKTVEVTFEKKTDVQMVTVCQPGHHGHGYGGYGHNYCKEVAQETAYNVPVVTPIDVPVTVAYPKPVKTCVDKPIDLPVVTCADIAEERTITVPSVEDSEVTVEKCVAGLGAPACQNVELTLPKQRCMELAFGHAYEPAPYAPHPEPAYAPAPAAKAEPEAAAPEAEAEAYKFFKF